VVAVLPDPACGESAPHPSTPGTIRLAAVQTGWTAWPEAARMAEAAKVVDWAKVRAVIMVPTAISGQPGAGGHSRG
jgi:hypothetical protein